MGFFPATPGRATAAGGNEEEKKRKEGGSVVLLVAVRAALAKTGAPVTLPATCTGVGWC